MNVVITDELYQGSERTILIGSLISFWFIPPIGTWFWNFSLLPMVALHITWGLYIGFSHPEFDYFVNNLLVHVLLAINMGVWLIFGRYYLCYLGLSSIASMVGFTLSHFAIKLIIYLNKQ